MQNGYQYSYLSDPRLVFSNTHNIIFFMVFWRMQISSYYFFGHVEPICIIVVYYSVMIMRVVLKEGNRLGCWTLKKSKFVEVPVTTEQNGRQPGDNVYFVCSGLPQIVTIKSLKALVILLFFTTIKLTGVTYPILQAVITTLSHPSGKVERMK